MSDLDESYAVHYAGRDPLHVYPVEFVVRAFLGSYPGLDLDKAAYDGRRILDLGFGDGRNLPLLHHLGFEVHGVEISERICSQTIRRMDRLNVPVDLRYGRSSDLPYPDGHFEYVLACHSCYYVDSGQRFSDNISEIARVLRPKGIFVFSAPMADTYILEDAEDLGDGHVRIRNDPYGIRNGVVFRKFDTATELEQAISDEFTDVRIGHCDNDFWGIREKVWIVACERSR